MNRKGIKFFCIALVGIFMATCQIPVTAESFSPRDEVLNAESEELAVRAETLIDQSVEAIINDDTETYKKAEQNLDTMGVEKVSYKEIISLTGYNANVSSLESSSVNSISSQTVTFRTQYLDYTQNGVTYDMMRIYATPTGSEGSLYRTGTTTQQHKPSYTKVKASAVVALNMAISTIAGAASDTISIGQSVYELVNGIYTACTSTSTLDNVKASYTWNIAETCSFMYFKNKSETMWHLKGRFSKASAAVGASVPLLSINGGNVYTSVAQKSYSGEAIPNNYNRVGNPFNAFLNGGIYESRITHVVIQGLAGTPVYTKPLANPSEPAEIY